MILIYTSIFFYYFLVEIVDSFIIPIDFSKAKDLTKLRVNQSLWHLGLQILVIAPVMEELIFREPIKVSKKSMIISCSILMCYMIISFLNNNINFYFFLIYILYLLTSYYVLSFFYKKKITLINIIITSVLFGFIHLNNFHTIELEFWHLYLYKIFPLIILGFYLAIIRLKLGTFWSVIVHFIFNLLPFTLNYVLK